VLKECGRLSADARPMACTVLLEASHPSLQRPLPDCLVRNEGVSDAVPPPHYWVYDYSNEAPYARAHPCDLVAAARRKAENDYQSGALRLEAPAETAFEGLELPEDCHIDPSALATAPAGTTIRPRTPTAGMPPLAAAAPAQMPASDVVAPDALAPPVVATDVGAGPVSASAALPAQAESAVVDRGLPGEAVALRPPVSGLDSHAPARAAITADICKGTTIYTLIYGGQQRNVARSYREPWRRLGASVPPIEDVYATARSAGRGQPLAVTQTTVRFHDADSKACAATLGPALGIDTWRVEPLSPRLAPIPGVVEVWLAPGPQAKPS
jgi:hypothetical protein